MAFRATKMEEAFVRGRWQVNVNVVATGVEPFIQSGFGRTPRAAEADAVKKAKAHVEKARKDSN